MITLPAPIRRFLERSTVNTFPRGIFALPAALLGLAVGPGGALAQVNWEAGPLTARELTSFRSVIAGRDAPQWSPDGSEILFMTSLGGGVGVYGISPEGGFPRPLVEDLSLSGTGSPGSQKPQWSPDGRWIGYVSSKGGAPEIWLWSVDDGSDVQLTDLGARVNALQWSPDGSRIVFSNDRYGAQDIWTVTVPDGALSRLTDDPLYETYPTWTPDGQGILYVRMDERWVDHDVLEMPAEGGTPRLVVEDRDFFDYRAGLSFGTPLPSPDGETVLFRSLRNGWHNFWLVPRSGGEPVPVAAAEADQSHARWSPDGAEIAYVENHNGTYELRVARVGGESRVLVRPDGMGVVDKPEWSPDGRQISYTLTTPTTPEDLFVVDVSGEESRQLTRSLPAGNLDRRLVVPQKVSYESTDGFTIPAYLLTPPEPPASDRGYPAIVWVHGGPTSQFDDSFGSNQQVQFFVQRGYVVLMPNVRGSSGYGKVFEDANNRCWGRCDLEDLERGVEFLRTLPEVNPDRMGITGTSYGGIFSMAAVAFAPGLFQAAIPISGYGDMADFHTEVPELQHIKLLEYELGPWPEEEELYRHLSPIHHVDDVTTPTFVMHGQGLEVEWRPEQKDPEMASLNFARALDKRYKIYRYKAYDGETYYVYGRENTQEKLQDMLEFFDQFLKDDWQDLTTTETRTERR
jgi:dipeptidyl aminopeptidase/acylaminoacyl peptidase